MRTATFILLIGAVLFLFPLTVGAEKGETDLLEAARRGDADAQFRLGTEYIFGKTRRGNLVLAFFWLRRAADGGHPQAQYNLGRCFEKGWGCRRSLRMAVKYYRMARKNVPEAELRYAELLYKGVAAEQGEYGKFPALKADPQTALALMRRLSETFPPARLVLVRHLFLDAPQHGKELREILEKYVQQRNAHPEALVLYATCLRSGIGGEADIPTGIKMLQRAAARHNMEAVAQLAEIIENGTGLPRDQKKAIAMTRRAAVKGNQRALVNLGNHHLTGIAADYDPAAAFKCFQRAAASGYPPALRRLGDCYADGMGVEKDSKQAFENYRAGAIGGDDEARCLLGDCYNTGQGVTEDAAVAFYWYTKAADAGSIKGIRKMAVALLDGRGVRKDTEKGWELLQRAAAAGDLTAQHLIRNRP